MNEKEICTAALEIWGNDAQVMMLFEEMGELMQAVCKVGRAMPGDKDAAMPELLANVAEEMADVEIMLSQMKILFGVEDAVKFQKGRKLERLEGRVNAARRKREEESGT